MGTTVRVASILEEGQTFHDKRTPTCRLLADITAINERRLTIAFLDVLEVHGYKVIRVEGAVKRVKLSEALMTDVSRVVCESSSGA